ncbi:conserved hypothetical protein [delta proteobacterium NaphS2]|nr:conserved hypothetical protein [delta proteobacterium NaphS2]
MKDYSWPGNFRELEDDRSDVVSTCDGIRYGLSSLSFSGKSGVNECRQLVI